MKKKDNFSHYLNKASGLFYLTIGFLFIISSIVVAIVATYRVINCYNQDCNLVISLIDFVGLLIISVAIYDVGRYLLEEEVFRDRELRSPKEARQSLTKFMVIVVIAATLEALLNVIRAGATDLRLLWLPAVLFFVATLLLVGLGVYQRFSVEAEIKVIENK